MIKKSKKIITALITASFILTICLTPVFASKNSIPYGIAKKAFNDLEKFPWAQQAIEKMRLKGLLKGKEEGKYAPSENVTKVEAIIMALRVMGWEDKISSSKLPEKYNSKLIENWAYGYVAVAYDKGILDDVDMMYFNPNEPAKRHEVAKYVIRALGMEKEALDYMDEELSFKDAPAIPQGSVGYVYLINDMKLMVGNDGKFNPMGTLSRAEMAVLFDRLDEKVDENDDESYYEGQIHSITNTKITVKLNEKLQTFDIDDNVAVYENSKEIRYSQLSDGVLIKFKLEDDKVIYIEVISTDDEDNNISKYSGTVSDIKYTDTKKITLEIEKMQIIFELTDSAEVYFKNIKGSFDDIKKGDFAVITVDAKNRASKIVIDRTIQNKNEISGTITSIDLTGTYHISIDETRYVLSKDAIVNISDKTNSDLEDLKMDDEVVCIEEDNIIVEITIQ